VLLPAGNRRGVKRRIDIRSLGQLEAVAEGG
jgi:hypothetical protein